MQRMIDCGTWDDPWFADLGPDAKLLFLYLLTNRRSTAAGAFEITIRAMAFETGIEQGTVERILGDFGERVQWWPEHQTIWVRNFFKRQAANDKFTISARRHIAELPTDVQRAIGRVYPDLVDEGVTNPFDDSPPPKDTHDIPTPKGMDTRSVDIDIEEGRDRVVEEEKSSARKRAPVASGNSDSQPFSLLESLCETLGQDVAVLSKSEKGKQLAVAKRLVEAGVTAGDVSTMVRWLKSQSWVTGGIDMFFLEKQHGKWALAGKPSMVPANLTRIEHPSRSTNASGQQNLTDQELDDIIYGRTG